LTPIIPTPKAFCDTSRGAASKTHAATRLQAFILIVIFVFGFANRCEAYSVLSHEAVVDSAWDDAIKPLLLRRFPHSTSAELKEAHSYAYGGSVIQDLGYYPFGSHLFSDLVHYIRTGDFVEALLRDSNTLDEYAFALGALAHYAADNYGHSIATNRAVPMLYPKLKIKFGDDVAYDQAPVAHIKTEFGFDVVQVAKGRYAPDSYRDFIGFHVSEDLLIRAFRETYCLDMKSIFTSYDLALGTYRRGVSEVIPKMTEAAWEAKRDDIQKDIPGITKQKFLYHLSRASYEKNWKEKYQKPSFSARLIAFFFRIVPKIGPFRTLAFKAPTPEAEKLFMASFSGSVTDYEKLLRETNGPASVNLVNDNFDTGTVTKPGEYPLADKTYADLLDRQAKNHFAGTNPELRDVILKFYSDSNAPIVTKKDPAKWAKVLQQVGELKALAPAQPPPITSAPASPTR
jgi:Zinc dependent phospholipase C